MNEFEQGFNEQENEPLIETVEQEEQAVHEPTEIELLKEIAVGVADLRSQVDDLQAENRRRREVEISRGRV